MKRMANYIYATVVLCVMGWGILSLQSSDDTAVTQSNHVRASSSGNQDFTFSQKVNLADSKTAVVDLSLDAGQLLVRLGSRELLEFDISYSDEEQKPTFEIPGNEGTYKHLKISQRSESGTRFLKNQNRKTEWDVRVNPDVLYNYKINMGAGSVDLDLKDSKVESIDINTGAGEVLLDMRNTSLEQLNLSTGVGNVEVDLSGDRYNDLYAEIKGGVGQVTLKTPAGYGVRFRARGLGSVSAPGFTRQGNYYVNGLFDDTEHTLDITISGGIGAVRVIEVD